MVQKELFYTESHEWVKKDGDFAYIGITDYAQKELGDVVYVELPSEGEEVSTGEPFGSVETAKSVEEIFSPLSGEVVKINSDLEDRPELLNSSPFEEGWLIKIRITNSEELENLLTAEEYKRIVEQKEN